MADWGQENVRYGAILADPPWRFETYSLAGRDRCPDFKKMNGATPRAGAPRHYETMATADIMAMPVAEAAADDCVLFLWATSPMLPLALTVMPAWGFEFKTVAFVWAKRTPRDTGWHLGLGYWTRGNAEYCLLGLRGSPKRRARDVRQLVVAARREHSRKPDEVYDRIEALVDGPYLEMFARTKRPGWDAWGDQAGRWQAHRPIGAVEEKAAVPPGQLPLV